MKREPIILIKLVFLSKIAVFKCEYKNKGYKYFYFINFSESDAQKK